MNTGYRSTEYKERIKIQIIDFFGLERSDFISTQLLKLFLNLSFVVIMDTE